MRLLICILRKLHVFAQDGSETIQSHSSWCPLLILFWNSRFILPKSGSKFGLTGWSEGMAAFGHSHRFRGPVTKSHAGSSLRGAARNPASLFRTPPTSPPRPNVILSISKFPVWPSPIDGKIGLYFRFDFLYRNVQPTAAIKFSVFIVVVQSSVSFSFDFSLVVIVMIEKHADWKTKQKKRPFQLTFNTIK